VIRNLPNEVRVTDIEICAVNSANQIGNKTVLSGPFFTEKGSLYKQYLNEIRRVEALRTEFVDTDFYNVSRDLFYHAMLSSLSSFII
jgi:hypothetical protein